MPVSGRLGQYGVLNKGKISSFQVGASGLLLSMDPTLDTVTSEGNVLIHLLSSCGRVAIECTDFEPAVSLRLMKGQL